MLHIPKILLLVVGLFLLLASPSLAQTWTVEAIDFELDEVESPAFCVLRSSEGFMLSHSPYQNANYVGFTGNAAGEVGLRWLPHGPIQQMKTLLQVDNGYKVLLNSTLHRVPKPESGGVLIDLYAYYPTGSELIDALRSGSQVFLRVAEDLTPNSSVQPSSETTVAYSLKGSAAAIEKLEKCAAGEQFRAATFDGLGAAIEAGIEAEFAKLADQKCEFDEGIWKSGTLEDARVFYFDDQGSTMKQNVYFERWVNNKVVARMYGNWISSLGVPVYAVDILKEHHSYDEDPEGDFLTAEGSVAGFNVEFIYESDRDTPETMIFVGLNQALWNRGSEHVDFYGDIEDPDHVFAGPNHFEFFACRPGPVTLSPPPK